MTQRIDGFDTAPPGAVRLLPLPVSALQALASGGPVDLAGLTIADGALPPPHVALRALALLQSGCSPQWAVPLAIVADEHNVLVGGCGFKGLTEQGVVEIGYGLSAAWHGRGYATWAVRQLLAAARQSGQVHEVIALIAPANLASAAVVTRAGFRPDVLIRDLDGEQVMRWMLPIA